MNHTLKIWPEFFHAVVIGHKRHEVRKFDRPYKAGDLLLLQEWDPSQFYRDCAEACISSEEPPDDDEDDKITAQRQTLRDRAYTGQSVGVQITYVTKGGTWGLPTDICVLSIKMLSQPFVEG